jgi:hypothetical protein
MNSFTSQVIPQLLILEHYADNETSFLTGKSELEGIKGDFKSRKAKTIASQPQRGVSSIHCGL